jgi:predicted DNA-binding transcriptional regulator AlpA
MRKLLDKSAVLQITGWSVTTLWRRMSAGEFPTSIDDGGRPRWYEDEVSSWIETRPRSRIKSAHAPTAPA